MKRISTRRSRGSGDAAEQGQGMAFVIGILQAADHGGGGADQLGELPLGEPTFRVFAQIRPTADA